MRTSVRHRFPSLHSRYGLGDSPGELMRHVLREEPVGHSGAVRYLRPDHLVHQDRDHLERRQQASHLQAAGGANSCR